MDHSHFIQAIQLERFADETKSQGILPELLNKLITNSCPNAIDIRIPYGNSINTPGLDGRVETDTGFCEFVPSGQSFWECSTSEDIQDKFTRDYKKRTNETSNEDRALTSLVLVTLRFRTWNETKQRKWLKKRENDGWRRIQIIDGIILANWIGEFPAVGNWLARKIGLTFNSLGFSTIAEYHEQLTSRWIEDLACPLELFSTDREMASSALNALFKEDITVLKLITECDLDIYDFIVAFLHNLPDDIKNKFSNQCLCIHDKEAWLSITELRSTHILIADYCLGLHTDKGSLLLNKALKKGHKIIMPLPGVHLDNNRDIIKLISPTQSRIETILRQSKYPETKIKKLGRIGGKNLSALSRYFRGNNIEPAYKDWDITPQLAIACLFISWDESKARDRFAFEKLTGKNYKEWISSLEPNISRAGSPLILNNHKREILSIDETYSHLAPFITNDILDKFLEIAIEILSERDPKFEMSEEKRYLTTLDTNSSIYSEEIRKGVASSLALIGIQSEALTNCNDTKRINASSIVIRRLLNNTDWQLWASLDLFLPDLAEAAPSAFLDALEFALDDLQKTPFHQIFKEEPNNIDILATPNYISGLLGALEILAWSPEFFPRVARILADLASIDIGTNHRNRPLDSLNEIFLLWSSQTTASFKQREGVIKHIIEQQPQVGWVLLISLLPSRLDNISYGSRCPSWSNFIPKDWKKVVPRNIFDQQVILYTNLAINLAKENTGRLCYLIEKFCELPSSCRQTLLNLLTSEEIKKSSQEDLFLISQALGKLISHHKEFKNSEWALQEQLLNQFSDIAQNLEPDLPRFKFSSLFSYSGLPYINNWEEYNEKQDAKNKSQQDAISFIIKRYDIDEVLKLAEHVDKPKEVGKALGVIASHDIENMILPDFLDSSNQALTNVAAGFVHSRFNNQNSDWIDKTLERQWNPELQVKFLSFLPFQKEVWEKAIIYLEGPYIETFWQNVDKESFLLPNEHLKIAIEILIKNKRADAALHCVYRMLRDESLFDEDLIAKALLSVLPYKNKINHRDQYNTLELIKRLQQSKTMNKDALISIEIGFLDWLNYFLPNVPITIDKNLAIDPYYFIEILRLAFVSTDSNAHMAEKTNKQSHFAGMGLKILFRWCRCPGTQDDNSFNLKEFQYWLKTALKLANETRHEEIAQFWIGKVLFFAPKDPDGFFLPHGVATELNQRGAKSLRKGYLNKLLNSRGVHSFTRGKEEQKFSDYYNNLAEELVSMGYIFLATTIRKLATNYKNESKREKNLSY